jgi:hypothetical protein
MQYHYFRLNATLEVRSSDSERQGYFANAIRPSPDSLNSKSTITHDITSQEILISKAIAVRTSSLAQHDKYITACKQYNIPCNYPHINLSHILQAKENTLEHEENYPSECIRSNFWYKLALTLWGRRNSFSL